MGAPRTSCGVRVQSQHPSVVGHLSLRVSVWLQPAHASYSRYSGHRVRGVSLHAAAHFADQCCSRQHPADPSETGRG
eukprot:2663059-Rhodomonas_salina.1